MAVVGAVSPGSSGVGHPGLRVGGGQFCRVGRLCSRLLRVRSARIERRQVAVLSTSRRGGGHGCSGEPRCTTSDRYLDCSASLQECGDVEREALERARQERRRRRWSMRIASGGWGELGNIRARDVPSGEFGKQSLSVPCLPLGLFRSQSLQRAALTVQAREPEPVARGRSAQSWAGCR